MPKYNLFFKPGAVLPEPIKSILKDSFSSKQLEKLSKFGGRVQISLTAPFTDRKGQKPKFIIDSNFLKSLILSGPEAEKHLAGLTKRQLTEVARLIALPLSSKSTISETRKSIIDHLFSSDKWSSISS